MKRIKKKIQENPRPIYMLVLIIIFLISVSAKVALIEVKKNKETPSFYQEYKDKGYPVDAKKIKKEKTNFYESLTLERVYSKKYISWVDLRLKRKLNIGQTVIASVNGKDYYGKINNISNQRNYNYGLYKVTINFSKSPSRDSWINANIIYKTKTAFSLNNDNITCNENTCYVWIIEDNKAHKKEVRIGEKDNQKTQILTNMNNDLIIVSDTKIIKDNMKVLVLKENK